MHAASPLASQLTTMSLDTTVLKYYKVKAMAHVVLAYSY